MTIVDYLTKFPTITHQYLDAYSICYILQQSGYQSVLCGGFVRDLIRGVECNDIDISTNATSDQIKVCFENTHFDLKAVGKSFGVVLVKSINGEYEIATFRKDVNCDGRHPEKVEFCSMEEDAKRRDFTMNAVFYDPISEEFFDFVNGIEDIKNHKLRFVGNVEDRIKEDYLRILRYLRFLCKGYEYDPQELFVVNKELLNIRKFVSEERIVLELRKLFLVNSTFLPLMLISEAVGNFIPVLFPDVDKLKGIQQHPIYHPEGDAYAHSILVFNYLNMKNASFLCQLAGLFHDVGKAYCTKQENGRIISHGHEKVSTELVEKWMKEYKFSTNDIEYVVGIVSNHMKFHQRGISKSTLRKLMSKPYFDELILHVESDVASSNKDFTVLNEYKVKIEDLRKEPILPQKFITGETLISIGMKPSEIFSTIINDMYDLQLEGRFVNEDEAINYLLENISKDGINL